MMTAYTVCEPSSKKESLAPRGQPTLAGPIHPLGPPLGQGTPVVNALDVCGDVCQDASIPTDETEAPSTSQAGASVSWDQLELPFGAASSPCPTLMMSVQLDPLQESYYRRHQSDKAWYEAFTADARLLTQHED